MSDASQLVDQAVAIADLKDYIGNFHELGGGEVNDTFLLEGREKNYALRVAKRPDLDTLLTESMALEQMDLPRVPREVFFDSERRIEGRMWILETAITGKSVKRLSERQFESLGSLLAGVHQVKNPKVIKLDLWQQFLEVCRYFGNEDDLLTHPDPRLKAAIQALKTRIESAHSMFSTVEPRLTHSDATPSNVLVDGDEAGLIDWEFARFTDPMLDFSTIYYEDMEHNQGKWRIHIQPEEKQALFQGYTAAGGDLDEDRITFWMNFDKVGAAGYLYWKLHQSGLPVSDQHRKQNEHDLEQLLESLKQYQA